MTFESNRLKHSSGVRVRIRFWRYDRKAVVAGSQNALMLAHSCHQAHSNLVSRFQNSYSTSAWIARVRRQKRSIEARMSSADLAHWNGVGSALRASMKAWMAASSSAID